MTARPNNALRLLALTALLAFGAFALAGCGGGDEKTYGDEPLGTAKKVTVASDGGFDEEQQAVIETIVAFGDATAAKDYAKLCSDVLTDSAAQLGKGNCEKFLEAAGADFKDFEIEVKSVTIGEDGESATVKTSTTRDGEASDIPYSMKKENGEWRVAILGQ